MFRINSTLLMHTNRKMAEDGLCDEQRIIPSAAVSGSDEQPSRFAPLAPFARLILSCAFSDVPCQIAFARITFPKSERRQPRL
jgi:hypothetical protein